jgi:hypothetical protein
VNRRYRCRADQRQGDEEQDHAAHEDDLQEGGRTLEALHTGDREQDSLRRQVSLTGRGRMVDP